MRLALFCFLISAIAAAQAPASNPQTVTTPAQVEIGTAANGIDPAYTIRSGAQLVILDVLVKDKKGQPVHNLPRSAFTVKENGTPQAIRNFEEHTGLTAAQAEARPRHPDLKPGEFTNLITAPENAALNIILYDVNNTSVKDQTYMRQQLIAYLRHARPDARTAVFALTTRLIMLQGFTSNPASLVAALADPHGQPQQSLLRDQTTGGVQLPPTSGIYGNAIYQIDSSISGNQFVVNLLDSTDKTIQSNQNDIRAYTTLDGLNDLARTLVAIPGRKNLIWFAGDFPPTFFPSENNIDGPYTATAALDIEFRDTVNLLARAQVAVYPIDASALRTDQTNNATQQNAAYASGLPATDKSIGPVDPGLQGGVQGSYEQVDHNSERQMIANEHQAMNQIARDTGGEAFYNHNDLTRMVTQAIDDGANFYSVAYVPAAGALDKNGLRAISVSLDGVKYDLSYRRGYYADKNQRIAAANGPAVRPRSSLAQALQPGSPQPTEVLLRLRAYPVTAPDQPNPAQGNQPNPDPKLARAPFRTFQVDTAASIASFSFAHAPDATYKTNVDFVTQVFDINGTLINSQSNTIVATYTKEKLAQAMRSGLKFAQQISVPAKGTFFLRVAVHDATSGHIGAVELPVNAVADLAPPAPLVSAAVPSSADKTP